MRKITSYYKEILIMTVIFLIEISAIVRANFFYNDDLGRNIEGYTGNAFDSRYVADWTSILVNGNSHITDSSPLTQILSCIFLAIAVVVVAYIFSKGQNLKVMHYVCGTLILSPYFLSNMSYKVDSAFMGLSVCVSVVPFLFRDKKILYYVSSVICLLVMCMTYQASSGIYPMMAIMLAFLEWNSKEKELKESLLFLLKSAVTYLLTLGFFALVLMKPIEEGYINTSIISGGGLIAGIINNYKTYYFTVVADFMKSWNILVFLVMVVLFVSIILDSKRNKVASGAMFVAMMVIMLLVVFGVYPAFSLPLILPRSMYGISFFIMICCFAIVSSEGLVVNIGKVIIFALAWCFFTFSFTYGNALSQQMKYVDFRTEEVINDLTDLECFMAPGQKNMIIEGDIGLCPALDNYSYDYVLIRKLVPVYLKAGSDEWNSAYFYRYFNLPDVKRVYEVSDISTFSLAQESAYHRILANDQNEIIVELK